MFTEFMYFITNSKPSPYPTLEEQLAYADQLLEEIDNEPEKEVK